MEQKEGKKNLLKMNKKKLNSYLLTTLSLIKCSELLGIKNLNNQIKKPFIYNSKNTNQKKIQIDWED